MCSHQKSYQIYANSIIDDQFKDGLKCTNWSEIPFGCLKKVKVNIGENPISNTFRGVFVVND